jgi:putative tryptophan/tyrosine transport system substrate-binding protein
VRRREFIAVLGGAAVASPAMAFAQESMPLIGFLNIESAPAQRAQVSAFRQGLKEAGYIEGQNVAVGYLWAEGRADRLPALAAQLVGRPVRVIAAAGTPAAFAAKAATAVIPIIFETAGDPVALGLVASLNRPGGNVTGITQLSAELVAKRVGLLHDLIPTAKAVGYLVDPSDPKAHAQSREMQEAARVRGLQIHVLNASNDREIGAAFSELAGMRADALIVGTGTNFFTSRAERFAKLAALHRMPAIYEYREFVMAGGLMSYGPSLADSYRLTGVYTGRVLKGENPADLPVARAVKFELVLNLKTANELGIEISPNLLAQADEVIE